MPFQHLDRDQRLNMKTGHYKIHLSFQCLDTHVQMASRLWIHKWLLIVQQLKPSDVVSWVIHKMIHVQLASTASKFPYHFMMYLVPIEITTHTTEIPVGKILTYKVASLLFHEYWSFATGAIKLNTKTATYIIHTYIHTHVCTHTHARTHAHTHIHTRIHTHMHTTANPIAVICTVMARDQPIMFMLSAQIFDLLFMLM